MVFVASFSQMNEILQFHKKFPYVPIHISRKHYEYLSMRQMTNFLLLMQTNRYPYEICAANS